MVLHALRVSSRLLHQQENHAESALGGELLDEKADDREGC